MTELNKILMIGRLTRDPELRYTPSGLPVAEFRIASNHTYRTKEEKREEVCFIDITLMGKQAEAANQYLTKGREVLVDGRLKFETWESKEGEKRSTYKIMADRFQFIGGKGTGGGGTGGEGDRYEAAASAGGGASEAPRPPENEAEDDLPF